MLNVLYFYCMKFFFEKSQKRMLQKKMKTDKKVRCDINFPRRTTTLPFKNLTLVTIFSKKSPQMPPNPLQGGLVYGNVTKVSFQNLQIFYIRGGGGGGNYTFQKQLFFIVKKKPKNKGRWLKSWGIVENGLYFENIRKKTNKINVRV